MATPPQALFVSYGASLGGAERILLDDAAALAGPVALACPEGPLAERARAEGIAVVPLARRRVELRASARDRLAAPLRIAAQGRELRAIVAEAQPGVVVASGMRALLSTAAALGWRSSGGPGRGARRSRRQRPRGPARRPQGPGRIAARPPLVFVHNDLLPSPLVGRAVRAAAARADLVVALSQSIADDLDPGGRLATRVEVIRHGVDLDRFAPRTPADTPVGTPSRPTAEHAARSASAAAATASPPTALVLGAIVGWKRPELALEAAALATRELPDLRLRFAGAPLGDAGERLLARLRERAAAPDLAGRVDFLGAVDDVPAALAAATCLLHCADREPYGMALVEALACGRPVVAPAAAGPLEIVDPSCGALYPPGDARAAAAALVEIVGRATELGPVTRVGPARAAAGLGSAHPATELAAAARARAEAHFDVAASRARFADLIAEVAP